MRSTGIRQFSHEASDRLSHSRKTDCRMDITVGSCVNRIRIFLLAGEERTEGYSK
jgi:hypothetical protein